MSGVDRRQVVLGALGASACASPSMDQCDPARGGFVRGLACADQYEQRQRAGENRLRLAEARLIAAQHQQTRLLRDRDRLQATLRSINSRISAINQQHTSLEQRLAHGLQSRNDIVRFVQDLDAALRAYDEGATEAIDFQPPSYMYADGVLALERARPELTASRAEARDIRNRMGVILGQYVAGQVVQDVLVRFLRWALMRLGLAFLNPLVSAAVAIGDFVGFVQLVLDLENANRG